MEMPEVIKVEVSVAFDRPLNNAAVGDLILGDRGLWRITRVHDDGELSACTVAVPRRFMRLKESAPLTYPRPLEGDRARSTLTGHHGRVVSVLNGRALFMQDGEDRAATVKVDTLRAIVKAIV